MKIIYQEFARNWLSIKNFKECQIMKKYAKRGKTIATFYVGKGYIYIIHIFYYL